MAPQGAPEVPTKMVPQNVKMETPSLPHANPRSQKGPAAEGVALKTTSDLICISKGAQGPRTALSNKIIFTNFKTSRKHYLLLTSAQRRAAIPS